MLINEIMEAKYDIVPDDEDDIVDAEYVIIPNSKLGRFIFDIKESLKEVISRFF